MGERPQSLCSSQYHYGRFQWTCEIGKGHAGKHRGWNPWRGMRSWSDGDASNVRELRGGGR